MDFAHAGEEVLHRLLRQPPIAQQLRMEIDGRRHIVRRHRQSHKQAIATDPILLLFEPLYPLGALPRTISVSGRVGCKNLLPQFLIEFLPSLTFFRRVSARRQVWRHTVNGRIAIELSVSFKPARRIRLGEVGSKLFGNERTAILLE